MLVRSGVLLCRLTESGFILQGTEFEECMSRREAVGSGSYLSNDTIDVVDTETVRQPEDRRAQGRSGGPAVAQSDKTEQCHAGNQAISSWFGHGRGGRDHDAVGRGQPGDFRKAGSRQPGAGIVC